MSEKGRKCVVILLDDSQMEVTIQPVLLGSELLDMAASHFKLKEREYFGLTVDSPHDSGDYVNWLENKRRVLEQDVPPVGVIRIHFTVRYFVERVEYFKDPVTVELFFDHARQAIFRGSLVCDSQVVFELAAFALQAESGDYKNEEATQEKLREMSWLPGRTLKEHVSISYCESQVIDYYQKMSGKTRGQALVGYLNGVMSLPTYGIHYYSVKDKREDMSVWLGFSAKGIGVYEPSDKVHPQEFYSWKHLDNIHCRDKKFSIEIYDASSRTALRGDSSSHRGGGPSGCATRAWYCQTTRMATSLFENAKNQHLFYLEKRTIRPHRIKVHSISRLSDLTRQLSHYSRAGKIRQGFTHVDGSVKPLVNEEEVVAAARRADTEMYNQLKTRRTQLQQSLTKLEDELQDLCHREARIIGRWPADIDFSPDHPLPSLRRKIGTSYKFPEHVFKSPEAEANAEIMKLDREIEIQIAITNAAERLSKEKTTSQRVRQERKLTYKRSKEKLQALEDRRDRLVNSSSTFYVPAVAVNGSVQSKDLPDSPGTLSKTSSYSSLISAQSKSTVASRDALDSVTEDIVANLIAGNRTPTANGGVGMGGGGARRHNSLSRLQAMSSSTLSAPPTVTGSPSRTKKHTVMLSASDHSTRKIHASASLEELSGSRSMDGAAGASRPDSPQNLTFSDTELQWVEDEEFFGQGTLV